MSSSQIRAITVDPEAIRSAADVHTATAADYQDYRARFEQWAHDVEAEIIRCHGSVAAPVAGALAHYAERIGDQVSAVKDQHAVMGEKLVAAATGYERADADGAAVVSAVGV
jgi:hypothetical protein